MKHERNVTHRTVNFRKLLTSCASQLAKSVPPWLKKLFFGTAFFLLSAIALGMDPRSAESWGGHVGEGATTGFAMLADSEMSNVRLISVFGTLLLAYLYFFKYLPLRPKARTVPFVLGGVFAFLMVVGLSFASSMDFSFVDASGKQFLLALVTFAGYWWVFQVVLSLLYAGMPTVGRLSMPIAPRFLGRYRNHTVLIAMVVLLGVWSLSALPFFPGSMDIDGAFQIKQYYGEIPLNLHHPYGATMVLGSIHRLGDLIFRFPHGGIFFLVALQSIGLSWVFGALVNLTRVQANTFFSMLALLFFAIVPLWWNYAQVVIKDTPFLIFCSWFFFEFASLFLSLKKETREFRLHLALAVLSAVGCCAFRYGSIFIVVPSLLSLLLLVSFRTGRGKLLLLASLLVLFSNYGLNSLAPRLHGIQYLDQQESLAIPLQQIGRTLVLHGASIPSADLKVLDRLVKTDEIPKRYDPQTVDPIKKGYLFGPAFAKIGLRGQFELLKVWLKLGLKFPKTYLEAFVAKTFAYYYPFYLNRNARNYYLNIAWQIPMSKYVLPQITQQTMRGLVGLWWKTPILSFLVTTGFYTWLGLFLVGVLVIQRRWSWLLLFVPGFMVLLISMAGPINGYMRYFAPLAVYAPVLLGLCLQPYLSGTCANGTKRTALLQTSDQQTNMDLCC